MQQLHSSVMCVKSNRMIARRKEGGNNNSTAYLTLKDAKTKKGRNSYLASQYLASQEMEKNGLNVRRIESKH